MGRVRLADWTTTPGGRFRSEGPFSGEQFREDVVAPAFRAEGHVDVDLDGVGGLPVGFLDEVFGGLAREVGPSIHGKVGFTCLDEPDIVEDIQAFIENGVQAWVPRA